MLAQAYDPSLVFAFCSAPGFQTEVSFILIFPTVLRIEKPCVVLKILDQRTDYANRSSNRLRVTNCLTGQVTNRNECFAYRAFHLAALWKKYFFVGKL